MSSLRGLVLVLEIVADRPVDFFRNRLDVALEYRHEALVVADELDHRLAGDAAFGVGA